MYVAVKGGEKAIAAAHRLLAEARRGDPAVPELSVEQIDEQLALAVNPAVDFAIALSSASFEASRNRLGRG